MKPWCDHPHCVRNYAHQHPRQEPEPVPEATGGSESDVRDRPRESEGANGTAPQRVNGWDARWAEVQAGVSAAESKLSGARGRRVETLQAMKSAGMSLGQMSEVTGLTRQRVGQLLSPPSP